MLSWRSAMARTLSNWSSRVPMVSMPATPARAGARQHARLVAGKLGEVEMAVAVDQHQLAAFAGSTKRGNTPCGLGSAVPGTSSRSKAANALAPAGTAS